MKPNPLPTPEDLPVASRSPRRLPPLSDVVASALGDTGWDVPFSNERLELLLRHIEAGYPLRVACGLCGLDESAYDRWCHGCPDISRAIDVAVEIARAPAIEAILAKARSGDARAWATWLRYSHKGVFGSSEMPPVGAKRSKHLLDGGNMVFPGELPRLRKAYEDFTEDGVSRAFVSPGLAARYASPKPQTGPTPSPSPGVACTQAQVVTSLKLEPGVYQPQAGALPDPNPFLQQARPTPSSSSIAPPSVPSPIREVAPPAVRPNPPASSFAKPTARPVFDFASSAAALAIGALLLFATLIGAAKASFLNDGSSPICTISTVLAGRFDDDAAPFSLRPHLPDPVYPVPILK